MRKEECKRQKERRTRIRLYLAFALVAMLYLVDWLADTGLNRILTDL